MTIQRPMCPKCQISMMLARIPPGHAGFCIHTFECPACDLIDQLLDEAIDPMKCSAHRSANSAPPFDISKDGLRKAHDQLFQLYILFFERAKSANHSHVVVRILGPKGGRLSLGDHSFLPSALPPG